ncbi:TM2 domain-containing protein [Marininema mesophilum]|uniref:TM2 domain-containing protein n=1 Tax=Marininema mesophilum TaxID=1048340 RepID=A0A1H2WA66_9BACL|nr:TM2 domain-containing protein [Marininema mesophilum]SDW77164.1 TM2 domain-containing protein [Marininema mesophilum]
MPSNYRSSSTTIHQTPEQNVRDRLVTAYLVWLFLGTFGFHRFYLGRKNSGLVMALLGPLFLAFGLFFYQLKGLGVSPWIAIAPFALWWLIDGLLIPSWARQATGARA